MAEGVEADADTEVRAWESPSYSGKKTDIGKTKKMPRKKLKPNFYSLLL